MAQFAELVVHLAGRRIASLHRFTLLGWTWPLVRQLAQLGVLVLVFSAVLDLGIENYAVFVFVGLIAWTWFAVGVAGATDSLAGSRHLVLQARFPDVVLPVVAVAVPFVDVLLALPVLLVMLGIAGELHATIVLLPLLLTVQLVLMCGLGWLAGAAAVYLRDVSNIVTVGLTLLFYLTPVFYDVSRVPERYEPILRLNPMTTLVEAYRAVVLDSAFPSVGALAGVAAASVLIAVAGALVFRRLQPGFVDEL
ncbi:MAG: ABC transporter permease [Solirubrobacterales bacterium]|nr:ABC transporter permease [Solirubrobacterales bacterium]